MPSPKHLPPTPSRSQGGQTGRERLIEASVRTLYERGYHGSSIRDIAREADMTSAALYHHFAGKQDLLNAAMTSIMERALGATQPVGPREPDSAAARLRALVEAWVAFHANSQMEAAVGAAELSSLDEAGRRTVIEMRDLQERMFADVITQGAATGEFAVEHPDVTAKAIITMGAFVASWYRPDGGSTPEEIAQTYGDLALAAVGATHPTEA